MLPTTIALAAALACGSDPSADAAVFGNTLPGDYGSLGQPADAVGDPVRGPLRDWSPQPGDVILSSTANLRVLAIYTFAMTGPPAHVGLVARMPDGRLGLIEAGREAQFTRCRLTPLPERLAEYPAEVWVRRRTAPLTDGQSAALTAFAADADGGRYAIARAAGQTFALARTRGPLRTFCLGAPRGAGYTYFCGELVIEALVAAGVVDAETARPSAIYPRDLFYDTSTNPYLNLHSPLGPGGWERPGRWVPPYPGRHVTFFGPYLPAVVAVRPNPDPDTLAGAAPYLAPAPAALGYDLPAPTPVKNPAATRSNPPPLPFRFGPSGVAPRLGPGPWTEPGPWVAPEPLDFPEPWFAPEPLIGPGE